MKGFFSQPYIFQQECVFSISYFQVTTSQRNQISSPLGNGTQWPSSRAFHANSPQSGTLEVIVHSKAS